MDFKFQFQFHKEYLDLFLVPFGLLSMFVYHLYLLYKHQNYPETTFLGLERMEKCEWVQRIVQQEDVKGLDRAVSVISSNISTATYLATISLTLTSLIGTWIGSNSNSNMFQSHRVYGDTRPFTNFIKNISLLTCFLLAFSGFVHASMHLIHANYLLSSPDNKRLVRNVEFAVTKGGEFCAFGLRSLYFALNMVVWYFGPIPMFVSSILMVINLYYHDIYTVKLHDVYVRSRDQKGSSSASFSY